MHSEDLSRLRIKVILIQGGESHFAKKTLTNCVKFYGQVVIGPWFYKDQNNILENRLPTLPPLDLNLSKMTG